MSSACEGFHGLLSRHVNLATIARTDSKQHKFPKQDNLRLSPSTATQPDAALEEAPRSCRTL